MTNYMFTRKIILLSFPEQEVVTVGVDLGYLGIENDFSEQLLLIHT